MQIYKLQIMFVSFQAEWFQYIVVSVPPFFFFFLFFFCLFFFCFVFFFLFCFVLFFCLFVCFLFCCVFLIHTVLHFSTFHVYLFRIFPYYAYQPRCMRTQRILRSSCSLAQTDIGLRCPPEEATHRVPSLYTCIKSGDL